MTAHWWCDIDRIGHHSTSDDSSLMVWHWQDWTSQHVRWQLCLPISRRGQLLGQTGSSNQPPPILHAATWLVVRAGRRNVDDGHSQTGMYIYRVGQN